MQKYLIAALLRFFTQHKPSWFEMDVMILIKEFFHIQIDITFEYFPFLFETHLQKQNQLKLLPLIVSKKSACLLPNESLHVLLMRSIGIGTRLTFHKSATV